MADLCQAPEPRPRVFRWRALLLDLDCRFSEFITLPTCQGVSALLPPPAATLSAELGAIAAEQMRLIMAQREALVVAFLAETGCKPSECEMVEEHSSTPDGVRVVVTVRKREGEARHG